MGNISFDIPKSLEDRLGRDGVSLAEAAKEAFLVDLYRNQRITQHQLAGALGLTRLETDGVLKRHGVVSWFTLDDLRTQSLALTKLN